MLMLCEEVGIDWGNVESSFLSHVYFGEYTLRIMVGEICLSFLKKKNIVYLHYRLDISFYNDLCLMNYFCN